MKTDQVYKENMQKFLMVFYTLRNYHEKCEKDMVDSSKIHYPHLTSKSTFEDYIFAEPSPCPPDVVNYWKKVKEMEPDKWANAPTDFSNRKGSSTAPGSIRESYTR